MIPLAQALIGAPLQIGTGGAIASLGVSDLVSLFG